MTACCRPQAAERVVSDRSQQRGPTPHCGDSSGSLGLDGGWRTGVPGFPHIAGSWYAGDWRDSLAAPAKTVWARVLTQ